MAQPIHDILNQLGAAITAQLEAANDRAASAEIEYARLREGLRALVGEAPKDISPAVNDAADLAAALTKAIAKPDPVSDGARTRTTIPDQPFLDALTSTWQGAHAIRKALSASGLNVAYGTVYKRMEKLTVAFPDMIEETATPARWRLREPSYVEESAKKTKAKRPPAKSRAPEAPPANDMPPAAITKVRERIAAAIPPQRKFTPALHRGDCFEIMTTIPDGSVDLILTDPPYATTGLDIDPAIDLTALWGEYRRIIRPTGTIVMFGSQPFSSRLVCGALDLFKQDLIWIKNRATQTLQARNRPLKQHEDILVFSAGTTIQKRRSSRRYTYNALGQVSAGLKKVSKGKNSKYLRAIKHNPGLTYEATANNPRTTLYCPKDKGNLHVFQKPLDLLEYLIRTYSNEGDLVLDTFMGSGSTCVAALRSGRRSIGIERSEKYFTVAQNRIAAETGESVMEATCAVSLVKPSKTVVVSANDNACGPLSAVSTDQVAIYNGDCLDVMRQMPSESIDLVFTSPPYNLGRAANGSARSLPSGKWKGMKLANGYASYDDARDPAEYIEWQKDVLRECWRLLSDDGAIFYNHKPRVQEGALQTPLDLNPGLPVRQIVIWDRKSGFNFNQSFYLPTHEWIVIFAKSGFRLRSKAASGLKDVWSVPPEHDNEHPAPFPVELAQRAIETTSASVILDPFMGSGSTGVATIQCGRKFVGIELDPGYCENAAMRMGLNVGSMAA